MAREVAGIFPSAGRPRTLTKRRLRPRNRDGDHHDRAANEAISFMVYCDAQDELDAYWEKLSAVPEAEQCGWLKDKYGLSWQVVPTAMDEMLRSGSSKSRA